MKNYSQQYNLTPCDEIIVPKSAFDLIQHHALYLGFDEERTDWIIENVYGIGVRLITADAFFKNNPKINEIRKFAGTNQERRLLVQRALKKIGKPYNLIDYNCQHFTSEIKFGKPVSRQIEVAFASLFLILVVSVFAGNK